MKVRLSFAIAFALMCVSPHGAARAADVVRVADGPFLSGGGYYVAREKGYFNVEVKGGTADAPKTSSALVAVNVAAEESNFVAVKEDELRSLMAKADFSMVDATSQAQQSFGSIGDEREVWRPLIIVLFVIIAIEFTLATLQIEKKRAEHKEAVPAWVHHVLPESWLPWLDGKRLWQVMLAMMPKRLRAGGK